MNLETTDESNLPKFAGGDSFTAPSDLQGLLARAEAEGISPDILTHTRRWNDKGRQWTPTQTQEWEEEDIDRLYEWVSNYQLNLEARIMDVQKKQNSIGLLLLSHETQTYARKFRAEMKRPLASDAEPLPRDEERLLADWEALDLEIRMLKHREKMLAPLYFLSCTHADTLPLNDPLLMALWGLALDTPGYGGGNRRGKEVEA